MLLNRFYYENVFLLFIYNGLLLVYVFYINYLNDCEINEISTLFTSKFVIIEGQSEMFVAVLLNFKTFVTGM